MQAIQYATYGPPDVLELRDIPRPVPGPGEVRVDLEAVAVLPVDFKLRSGALTAFFDIALPKIPGRDGVGTVGALGPGVDYAKLGDRVAIVAGHLEPGTYAQSVVRARDTLVPVPDGLSSQSAAALIHSGLCCLTCLEDIVSLSSDTRILIHGGAGAIGSLAIQLARSRGAFVATTCRASNRQYVTDLGADLVFAYDAEDFSRTDERFDVVFDLIGGEVHRSSYKVLRPGGHMVCLRAAPIEDLSKDYGVTTTMAQMRETPELMARVMARAAQGVLRGQVRAAMPLSAAAEAHAEIEAGRVTRGRLILEIPPSDPALARPQSYLTPLSVRGRIHRAQPLGLPIINLGFNELPYPPTPAVAQALAQTVPVPNVYGNPSCEALRGALGAAYGLDPETLVCGNGSEELLDVIARNFVQPGDDILISEFGYIQFALTANRLNASLIKAPETAFTTHVDALLAAVTPATKLVFLANPNNPTGTALPAPELERLAEALPRHIVLVLDLAYGEFWGLDSCARLHGLVSRSENVVVTRTFSKAFGLAGVRAGWCHVPAWMAPHLYAARGMGSVNAMAQAAATASLGDMDIVKTRIREINAERDRMRTELAGIGIETLPSAANFLAATLPGEGPETTEALVVDLFDKAGLIVNRTRETGLEHYFRFTVSLRAHNDLLIQTAKGFVDRLRA